MISEKEMALAISEVYFEKYNFVLTSFYKIAYDTTPQAFRLADKSHLKIVLLKLKEDLFLDNNLQVFICYKKNANFTFENIELNEPEDYENFSDFKNESAWMNDVISKRLNITDSDILFNCTLKTNSHYSRNDYNSFKTDYDKTMGSLFITEAKRLVAKHGSDYQKHSNLVSGYYAKNAAKYSYSLLDLKPIIAKVSNEDFEYQLDQAIAAYDNSLYMASAATLGVCLETVCKLILMNKGKKVKDSDPTMLDKLSERLKCEGLINYKDKSRIDICYKLRNLSSHTSPGKTTQQDCHFIIGTIQSLVEEYF